MSYSSHNHGYFNNRATRSFRGSGNRGGYHPPRPKPNLVRELDNERKRTQEERQIADDERCRADQEIRKRRKLEQETSDLEIDLSELNDKLTKKTDEASKLLKEKENLEEYIVKADTLVETLREEIKVLKSENVSNVMEINKLQAKLLSQIENGNNNSKTLNTTASNDPDNASLI